MDKSHEILNELKGISPLLAGMEKINVYKVPEKYFDGLAEKITIYAFLNQENRTDFNKNPGQQVPGKYFDTLSDQILSKVKKHAAESANEELQSLSPLLFSLKDKNVFTIPSGYFENVSNSIIQKLNRKPAKIVSISRAKWWKYAAAAVITAAIAISSLQIFNSSPDMQKDNSVVTESTGLPDYIKSSFQYKTPEQVDEGIASLSDDEIAKYLEKHGNIMDNETLIKEVDVNKLPDPTDYLTDDDALNNYLNTIDAKSNNRKTP